MKKAQLKRPGLVLRFVLSAALLSVSVVGISGCVSKATADARARAAFLAGQQQALQQTQLRGPSVTFFGQVKNSVVPWTAGLTLAQGLLVAEYTGTGDPKGIVIHRGTEKIQVEPARLLSGEDIPLQPWDSVEVFN